MSLVDEWLAGLRRPDLDDPEFIAELRKRFWLAEAAEFARDQLGIEPDEETLEALADELRDAEAKLLEEEENDNRD